jgi:hypothetical protein
MYKGVPTTDSANLSFINIFDIPKSPSFKTPECIMNIFKVLMSLYN